MSGGAPGQSGRQRLAERDQVVELGSLVVDRIDAKPFAVMQQMVVLRMVGHHENVLLGTPVMAMSDHPDPGSFSQKKIDQGNVPLVGMAVKPVNCLLLGGCHANNHGLRFHRQDLRQIGALGGTVFNQKHA